MKTQIRIKNKFFALVIAITMAITLALSGSAWAATWTGGKDTSWSDDDNWSGGSAPVTSGTATFTSAGSKAPNTGTTEVTLDTLDITGLTDNVTITAGAKFKAKNYGFTIPSGTITLAPSSLTISNAVSVDVGTGTDFNLSYTITSKSDGSTVVKLSDATNSDPASITKAGNDYKFRNATVTGAFVLDNAYIQDNSANKLFVNARVGDDGLTINPNDLSVSGKLTGGMSDANQLNILSYTQITISDLALDPDTTIGCAHSGYISGTSGSSVNGTFASGSSVQTLNVSGSGAKIKNASMAVVELDGVTLEGTITLIDGGYGIRSRVGDNPVRITGSATLLGDTVLSGDIIVSGTLVLATPNNTKGTDTSSGSATDIYTNITVSGGTLKPTATDAIPVGSLTLSSGSTIDFSGATLNTTTAALNVNGAFTANDGMSIKLPDDFNAPADKPVKLISCDTALNTDKITPILGIKFGLADSDKTITAFGNVIVPVLSYDVLISGEPEVTANVTDEDGGDLNHDYTYEAKFTKYTDIDGTVTSADATSAELEDLKPAYKWLLTNKGIVVTLTGKKDDEATYSVNPWKDFITPGIPNSAKLSVNVQYDDGEARSKNIDVAVFTLTSEDIPVSDDVTPPVSDDVTPPVSDDITPPVSDDVTPPVSDDVTPPVSDDVTPPVSDDVTPPVSDDVTPPPPDGNVRPNPDDSYYDDNNSSSGSQSGNGNSSGNNSGGGGTTSPGTPANDGLNIPEANESAEIDTTNLPEYDAKLSESLASRPQLKGKTVYAFTSSPQSITITAPAVWTYKGKSYDIEASNTRLVIKRPNGEASIQLGQNNGLKKDDYMLSIQYPPKSSGTGVESVTISGTDSESVTIRDDDEFSFYFYSTKLKLASLPLSVSVSNAHTAAEVSELTTRRNTYFIVRNGLPIAEVTGGDKIISKGDGSTTAKFSVSWSHLGETSSLNDETVTTTWILSGDDGKTTEILGNGKTLTLSGDDPRLNKFDELSEAGTHRMTIIARGERVSDKAKGEGTAILKVFVTRTSKNSNGGCDAGLGVLALVSALALIATKKNNK